MRKGQSFISTKAVRPSEWSQNILHENEHLRSRKYSPALEQDALLLRSA